jgi:pantetheine-phosphate adenylyltransferase
MTTAIFPGTFDPITIGHTDLIQRASKLFDELIVAVADNQNKNSLFSLDERLQLAEKALHGQNVKILPFSGLLVKFAKQQDAHVIIRGVRSHADFEYELQMTQANSQMAPDIETVYLTPSVHLSFIASSLVREIASLGGDVSAYVDATVADALQSKFSR